MHGPNWLRLASATPSQTQYRNFCKEMQTSAMVRMRMLVALVVVVAGGMLVGVAHGHGMLMQPLQRSSLWRDPSRFPNARSNYDDNQLYCGGYTKQWVELKGKCGVCGDPYDQPQPRANEANGVYGKGYIAERYRQGQVIDVIVRLTMNHKGYFIFKLCPNNNIHRAITHECLDRHVLMVRKDNGEMVDKYFIGTTKGDIHLKLQLPRDVTCTQCVLQWTYNTGNSYNCFHNRTCCVGCGPQENFVNCADVAISSGDGSDPAPMTPRPVEVTTERPVPTTEAPVVVKDLRCRGIPPFHELIDIDNWCTTNCGLGECDETVCACD